MTKSDFGRAPSDILAILMHLDGSQASVRDQQNSKKMKVPGSAEESACQMSEQKLENNLKLHQEQLCLEASHATL